jgi:hypothetical protein
MLCIAGAGIAQNSLFTPVRRSDGWIQLSGHVLPDRVVRLEASTNLLDWSVLAMLDQQSFNPETWALEATNDVFAYTDPSAVEFNGRFYRYALLNRTVTNDWRNQVQFPNDSLIASESGADGSQIRWVKFAIPLNEPWRVYYQDRQKYLLHYDFASKRLEPFRNLTRAQFDQLSLFSAGRQVVLGTLLLPADRGIAEYGVQFSGQDPFPGESIARYFELVRSTVTGSTGVVPYYFPTYEQSQAAALDEAFLASKGIRLSSPNRWVQGNQVYASGWAFGRLKRIAASDINAAYADGRLTPQDILLTDGVPAEVPFLAGIVSTSPATPNSHVAILANGYGVPFACVADPVLRSRVEQWVGREIVFQASVRQGVGLVSLFQVDETLPPVMRAEILALKQPAEPEIQPMASYGAYGAPTAHLTLGDVRFFGGKASNYGLLNRLIPANCPSGMAFSFDLWNDFLSQTMASGKTLRSEILERLAVYSYPPDMVKARADLAQIRGWITQAARFSETQKQSILGALTGFDTKRNLRFRSSSNAEDAKTFSAAGLYDSYSGCLADDLDSDSTGPCQCDTTEVNERGVFRAMQKVYASFYNDNAFLERLRLGMDESQVGMALLVHYSNPDAEEMANGVAKVSKETGMFGQSQLKAELVTQTGAVSVTNPEGNAKPETVDCYESGYVQLTQPSSLVPLGSQVMSWEQDYNALSALLFTVYKGYPQPSPGQNLTLDLEYKKLQPGKILIKQVREFPVAAAVSTVRWLLNEPTRYWVFQSEGSDALANHRLKCFLSLQTSNFRLDATNLAQCFYTDVTLEYREGTMLKTLSGAPTSWPDFAHQVSQDPRRGAVVTDRWSVGAGTNQRQFQLTSVIPITDPSKTPFLAQAEIRKWLKVTYATPVPALDWQGVGVTTTSEEVQLVAAPESSSLRPGTVESFANQGGIRFELAFLNSTNASSLVLGIDPNLWGTLPASLSPWLNTRITGLTPETLELRGYWSQSAKAGHKYRYAWYTFEPELEPGLSTAQLQALREKNVALIWVEREVWDGGEVKVRVLGFDGKFRAL